MAFVLHFVTADALAARWVEFVKNVTVVNMRLKVFHQRWADAFVCARSVGKMGQREMYGTNGTRICLRQERDAEYSVIDEVT